MAPQIEPNGAYMRFPVRFFVALMSQCTGRLDTVHIKGKVGYVAQLC